MREFLRGQPRILATMSMKQVGLSEATNILLHRFLAKVYPLFDIIANRFRQSPHISAEDLHTFHLLSFLTPRCSQEKLAVSRKTKLHDAHDVNFMPLRL